MSEVSKVYKRRTDLENPPAYTAKKFANGEDGKIRSEHNGENCAVHPEQEEEHRPTGSKLVLSPSIDDETEDLADHSGVADTRLPSRSDNE